jgi:putative transposon-encoded protein
MNAKFIRFIYTCIYGADMRKIIAQNGKLKLTDDVGMIFEKIITKFGNGAKIDAPKDHIGKKVYVLIRK